MPDERRAGEIAVLECDPDLGEDLPVEEIAAARSRAHARVRCYARGRWDLPLMDPVGHLGLLIVKGFAARELTVGGYTSMELLGPGDVVQPWLRPDPIEQAIAVDVEWTVFQRLQVALLDRGFLDRVSEWPQITAAISRRLTWRTHWLLFQVALSALRRIDDRVLLMLWQYADRWGTVTPRGISLDVPLTHELLASVVGGRRPSVSAAVGRLVEEQQIEPLRRSRWLLLGEPPARFHDRRGGERH